MVTNMKVIGYARVSTARQGASGLGLEAQRAAIEGCARSLGATVTETHTDIESGKMDDRPALALALSKCKLTNATLVVAKLDRLSREVHLISALMKSGVAFICADNPNANRLTIHILSAVAENEREMIAKRTRDALAAAKARGTLLGGARPGAAELSADAKRRGAAVSVAMRQTAARERAAALLPLIEAIRSEGYTSLRQIAGQLDARGIPSARGGPWQACSVKGILAAVVSPIEGSRDIAAAGSRYVSASALTRGGVAP